MSLYPAHSPVPETVRHAALLLHSLPAGDRSWALGQMTPLDRDRLQPLLDELVLLGIPRDRTLIDQGGFPPDSLPSQPSLAETHATQSTAYQLLATLDADGCKELTRFLLHEPPRLLAILLAQGPWPWERTVLLQLSGANRQQVQDILHAPQPTPKSPDSLSTAIVETVAERVKRTLEERRQEGLAKRSPSLRHRLPWISRLFPKTKRAQYE